MCAFLYVFSLLMCEYSMLSVQKMTLTPATTMVVVTNVPSFCSAAWPAVTPSVPAPERSSLHVAWCNSPITSGVHRQNHSQPACKAMDTHLKRSTKECLVKTKVWLFADLFFKFIFVFWWNKMMRQRLLCPVCVHI